VIPGHVVDGDAHVGLPAAANGGAEPPTEGAIPRSIRITWSTQGTRAREAEITGHGGGSVRRSPAVESVQHHGAVRSGRLAPVTTLFVKHT
jgi:hypothetical protein